MKNIKKTSYLWILTGLFLVVGCDPLADDINEIEKTTSIAKELIYTLTDDDYDTADDECGCSGFGNFGSEEDAAENIPIILADVFPGLGNGSSALVTYDIFNGSSPDLRGDSDERTVSDAEYDELGFSFGNFDDKSADLALWANTFVSGGSDGDYVDVTYEYFGGSGTDTTVDRVVYTVAYGWMYAFQVTQDMYDFFGESSSCYGVPDFSFDDEASGVLPVYLNEFMTLFIEEGDRLLVQFNYDNGEDCVDEDDVADALPEVIELSDPTEQDVILYIFSGGEWVEYGDGFQVTQNVLNLGHDGKKWVPDNTIKYTLGTDDFNSIATASSGTNSAGADSMNSFGNYDLTLWSSDEIFNTITARLVELFPTVEGQKYLVSYAVWRPGSGVDQLHVVWNGTAYVLVEDD